MEKIVHNHDSLLESDVNRVVKRAKALIVNSNNEIALCFSHNNYFFLGGHVENEESDYACLKREIKEEAGIDFDFSLDEPFFSIIYYNRDYPEKGMNTKTEINYYVLNADIKVDSKNTSLTEDEKSGNFEIKFIDRDKICSVLEESLSISTIPAVTEDTLKICKLYYDSLVK